MATGIASPWGQSSQMVAGMNNSLDAGMHHLTGEQSLTSYPPTFNGNTFVSPLTIKNASYYSGTAPLSFGKSKKLKDVILDIKYLKRV
jgi:hypothetical protein